MSGGESLETVHFWRRCACVHLFRLRRRRNQAEYPAADQPGVEPGEVERDLPKAREIVEAASRVLDQMGPY